MGRVTKYKVILMDFSHSAEVKSHNLSTNTETAQDTWDQAQSAIFAAGRRVLGVSKGGRNRQGDMVVE